MASTVNKKKKSTSTRKKDRQDFVLSPQLAKISLSTIRECLSPHFPRSTMVKQGQQGVLWEMCKWRIRERIAAKAHKVEEGLSSSKWNNFYLLGNSQGETLRIIFGQSQ